MQNEGKVRTNNIIKNVKLTFLFKIWISIVTFLQVPIIIDCLGTYQNGVWLTISSLILWIDIMDIGLGNGLRNKLSEAIAEGNRRKARQIVSSAFVFLCLIVLPIFIALEITVASLDMHSIFNTHDSLVPNLPESVLFAVAMVCCTFVFKLTGNVYMGLQLPAMNSLIQACGLSLALLFTYLLYYTQHANFFNIVAVNTGCPVLTYIFFYPYTFWYKYPYLRPSFKFFNKDIAVLLLKMGVKFFCIQLGSLFLFASSNMLISQLYNPSIVTTFQISYRYMTLLLTAFTIVAMPLWNATTDAFTKGDWEWIVSANRKMNKISLLFVLCMLLMFLLSKQFYNIWINNDKVIIPYSYTFLIGIYVILLILSTRYSYFLNGVGALRLQLIFTFVDALLFIILAVITSMLSDKIEYFIIIMCITQIPGLIVNKIQFSKIINNKAEGIWKIA